MELKTYYNKDIGKVRVCKEGNKLYFCLPDIYKIFYLIQSYLI